MNFSAFQIHFDPFLSAPWLWAFCVAVLVLTVFSVIVRKRALVLRFFSAAFFLLFLFNPSLVKELREPVQDVAVVVVDQSQSQKFGKRSERTEAMLEHLQEVFANQNKAEMRVVYAPRALDVNSDTRLFTALDQALSDVPVARRAGVVFLSDGQIHDVPVRSDMFDLYGPVYGILSGEKDETDRQIRVLEAPAYGITGQSIPVMFRVDDHVSGGTVSGGVPKTVVVTIDGFEGKPEVMRVPVGEDQVIDLPVQHAGQNVFELSVEGIADEITLANNKTALIVNGVRDRLKTLLVSGQPHAGGRTWRDLLKSDPGVDLVHFTILREPTKLDATPQNELSLIAFPFRELFEIKLYDFDLIIFDRYSLNRILPDRYFQNIVRYVEDGGALLISSGPDFSGAQSLYSTALSSILPGQPNGQVFNQAYVPRLNDNGRIHPVTMGLTGRGGDGTAQAKPEWGSWLRQIALVNDGGDILMNGLDDQPLLILDRVKKGRVAQLASDHIWLWSRGYEGGGPSVELLRRMVHWLMKEPELDEEALSVEIRGQDIFVQSRHFSPRNPEITVTRPDGTQQSIVLKESAPKLFEAQIAAQEIGVYRFEDDAGQSRYAVVGDHQQTELKSVITTRNILAPLVESSGGGFIWAVDRPTPDLRFSVGGGASLLGGGSAITLRSNNQYLVSGVESTGLFNIWLAALLFLILIVATWWFEGRER